MLDIMFLDTFMKIIFKINFPFSYGNGKMARTVKYGRKY